MIGSQSLITRFVSLVLLVCLFQATADAEAIEGHITQLRSGDPFVAQCDLGTKDGIKANDRLLVYRADDAGLSLAIGELKVSSIRDRQSGGIFVGKIKPREGDRVRFEIPGDSKKDVLGRHSTAYRGQSEPVKRLRVSPESIDPSGGAKVAQNEELFCLRVLENTYACWPTSDNDPAVVREWTLVTHSNLTRLKTQAQISGCDAKTISLFDDSLRMLGEYDKYLSEIGIVELVDVSRYKPGAGTIFMNGVGNGASVFGTVAKLGGPVVAGIAGLIACGVSVDSQHRDNAHRDEAVNEKRNRVLTEGARRVNSHFHDVVTSAAVLVKHKTEANKWIDGPTFELKRVAEAKEEYAESTSNPFVIARYIQTQAARHPSPTRFVKLAKKCIAASENMPAGGIFDDYRAEFILHGARLRTAACGFEQATDDRINCSNEAIKLYSRASTLVGKTQFSDAVLVEWGMAAAFAQDFEGAKRRYDEVMHLKDNPYFAYNYACVMSQLGRQDEAWKWLQSSVKNGFSHIREARRDPDLLALRGARGDEFEEFLTPSFRLRVDWARWFGSDRINITNTSAFTLTDVSIKIAFEAEGAGEFTATYEAESIEPGETKFWDCKITSRGPKVTGGAELRCEENRR